MAATECKGHLQHTGFNTTARRQKHAAPHLTRAAKHITGAQRLQPNDGVARMPIQGMQRACVSWH